MDCAFAVKEIREKKIKTVFTIPVRDVLKRIAIKLLKIDIDYKYIQKITESIAGLVSPGKRARLRSGKQIL